MAPVAKWLHCLLILGSFASIGGAISAASAAPNTCEDLFAATVVNAKLLRTILEVANTGSAEQISGTELMPTFTVFTASQVLKLWGTSAKHFPYLLATTRRGHSIFARLPDLARDPYVSIFVVKDIGLSSGVYFNQIEAKDKSSILRRIRLLNGRYEKILSEFDEQTVPTDSLVQRIVQDDESMYPTENVEHADGHAFLIRKFRIHSRRFSADQVQTLIESLRDI